jgi:hypothetical protein
MRLQDKHYEPYIDRFGMTKPRLSKEFGVVMKCGSLDASAALSVAIFDKDNQE